MTFLQSKRKTQALDKLIILRSKNGQHTSLVSTVCSIFRTLEYSFKTLLLLLWVWVVDSTLG